MAVLSVSLLYGIKVYKHMALGSGSLGWPMPHWLAFPGGPHLACCGENELRGGGASVGFRDGRASCNCQSPGRLVLQGRLHIRPLGTSLSSRCFRLRGFGPLACLVLLWLCLYCAAASGCPGSPGLRAQPSSLTAACLTEGKLRQEGTNSRLSRDTAQGGWEPGTELPVGAHHAGKEEHESLDHACALGHWLQKHRGPLGTPHTESSWVMDRGQGGACRTSCSSQFGGSEAQGQVQLLWWPQGQCGSRGLPSALGTRESLLWAVGIQVLVALSVVGHGHLVRR